MITIPAYFNDNQRHATKLAAARAGLTCLGLLPEPTAAAISYGFKPDNPEDKVVAHPEPMYAIAQGAAIVAAGQVEKVGTVSRDYFIELVDEPRHKFIRQGDILPVKECRTFGLEADNQRLIHFKFFNRDEVRQALAK